MGIKTKISTAIATGAVLATSLAPAAFANSIEISGNGAFSDNSVDFTQRNTTRVVQSNDSNISNTVRVSNDTGGNSSSFNTGGDTTIRTGNASSDVSIVNEGNSNVANLQSCGCESGTDISIHGNGAFSENGVDVDTSRNTSLVQRNTQDIDNNVHVDNSTGNGSYDSGSGANYQHSMPYWNNNYQPVKYDNKKYDNKYSNNKYSDKKYDNNYSDYWWMMYMKDKMHKSYDNFDNYNRFMSNNRYPLFLHNIGGNTGGDTHITTGDADSSVSIYNSGGTNILH
jgi:hypothetical protein